MEITFTNGSAEQQAVVRQTLGELLNFDLARYQFAMTYEFVAAPVPDPFVHLPLAVTISGTGAATTQIRDDFPHFAGQEDIRWAQQAVAHEMGHAILHQLPSDVQAQIASMFGTTVETWEPTDRAWPQRPEEGIAETFKDAFLPQRDRMTSNSTDFSIPISKYGRFRSLFRRGVAAVSTVASDPFLLSDGSLTWPNQSDPGHGLKSYSTDHYPDDYLAGYTGILADPFGTFAGLGLPDAAIPSGTQMDFTITVPSADLFPGWTGGLAWEGAEAPDYFPDNLGLEFHFQMVTFSPDAGFSGAELLSLGWAPAWYGLTDQPTPLGTFDGIVYETAQLLTPSGFLSDEDVAPLVGPGGSVTHTLTMPGPDLSVAVTGNWQLRGTTNAQIEISHGVTEQLPPIPLDTIYTLDQIWALQPRLELPGSGGTVGPQTLPVSKNANAGIRSGRRHLRHSISGRHL